MKKIIIFIITLLIYSNVYADLTDSQSLKVAKFAKNFIVEGMSEKHIDSKGMPVFAYGQGPARVEGYLEKLSYVKRDYSNSITINSNKWNFDCASFVSYVLKKTVNLTLLDSMYLGGNPYMVNNYVDDTNHFIRVVKSEMNYDAVMKNIGLYKPGDLIVQVGSHIGMYIGNNEVAEFSSYQIGKYSTNWTKYRGSGQYNLGSGIISLSEFVGRAKQARYLVLRIKDGVVNKNYVPNTTITWLDTNETENLVLDPTPTPVVAKDVPKVSISPANTNYVERLTLNISIKDEDGIIEYQIYYENNLKEQLKLNKVKNYDFNYEVIENGTYYVSAKDSFGKETKEMIIIDTIDNNPPMIESLSYSDNSLIVFANDSESGLAEEAYSFDNCESWQIENTFEINKNGQYIVCVKDKINNISKKIINVDEIEEKKENKPIIIDNDNKEKNDESKDNTIYIIIGIVVVIVITIIGLTISMIRKKDNVSMM